MSIGKGLVVGALLWGAGWVCLYGQDPVSIRFTVENGLPANEVYDVWEDDEGYIWFATDHGISQYDFTEFRNYSTQDGLSHNTVLGFEEDPAGRIWMRCWDGSLSIMAGGKISSYGLNEMLRDSLRGEFVETMYFKDANQLLFTTSGNLPRTRILDLSTGRMEAFPFPEGTTAALCRAENGCLLPAIRPVPLGMKDHAEPEGMFCNEVGQFWRLAASNMNECSSRRVLIARAGDGAVLVFFCDVLYRIQGCRITHTRKLQPGTYSIQSDRVGRTWLLGDNGMLEIDSTLQVINALFPKETIIALMQDRHKNYWICTVKGVLMVPDLRNRVYNTLDGKSIEDVRRLQIFDSTLYVLHGKRAISAASISMNGLQWRFTIHSRYGTDHDFCILPRDTLLLHHQKFYDLNHHQQPVAVPPWYIPSIGYPWQYRVQGRKLLICTNETFQVFEEKGANYKLNYTSPIHWGKGAAILYDERGKVWIGTNHGVYIMENQVVLPFQHACVGMRARVTDFALIRPGLVAIATRGEGVWLSVNGQIYKIPQEQLPSMMCDRLFWGPSGLWVCSNVGLSLLQPPLNPQSQITTRNFGVIDGLPSNKVNDVLEWGNEVYVATDKGIATFDLGWNNAPKALPTKVIQIKANDRVVARGEALLPSDDNLQFRFQGFTLPPGLGAVTYRYQLEGYDPSIRTTSERIKDYYNLPPGNYTFRVAACYSAMPEANYEDAVVIDMPPRLHESTWFQVWMGAMMVLVLVLGVRRYLTRRQRRHQAKLDHLRAEVKALRSQMHPHFIFNALNSIQHLIMLQDNDVAQMHLVRFAKLMRGVLEATNHEMISISQEIDILQNYLELEKLRLGDDFVFVIDLQQGIDWELCKIPPMLLQPLIENAIWHGLRLQKDCPTLRLALRLLADGRLCCEVIDNGIGRAASALLPKLHVGPSVAMANIEERIRLINATHGAPITLEIMDLMHANGRPAGTSAKLFLPQFFT